MDDNHERCIEPRHEGPAHIGSKIGYRTAGYGLVEGMRDLAPLKVTADCCVGTDLAGHGRDSS